MLRSVLWTLRQRRYAMIAAGMLVLAIGCVMAGTWQIQRFQQSVHDNDALTRNARAVSTALTAAGVPVTGARLPPKRDAIRFRTVSVSGIYLPTTGFLGGQTVAGGDGYYAISPLDTAAGVVLVVRGLVADVNGHPGPVPAAPTGTVRIVGRLDTAASQPVANPTGQSHLLGRPVFQALLKLLPGQPGGAGLAAVPKPDLSNPAGGAYEGQHFAYIVQWYFFALLALVAPFLLARNEVREAQRRFLGLDVGDLELGLDEAPAAISASTVRSAAEVAVRSRGAVARTGGVDTPELARAKRLADRYGRSLALGTDAPVGPASPPRRREPTPVGGLTQPVPNSAEAPHRSHDGYHGSYNDYLWQLGLADGDTAGPELEAPPALDGARAVVDPVVIDVEPAD